MLIISCNIILLLFYLYVHLYTVCSTYVPYTQTKTNRRSVDVNVHTRSKLKQSLKTTKRLLIKIQTAELVVFGSLTLTIFPLICYVLLQQHITTRDLIIKNSLLCCKTCPSKFFSTVAYYK